MLNHQLILTDSEGRLRTTLEPPDYFNGGTPTKDGLLSIAYVDAEFFVNGLGYIVGERSISAEQNRVDPSGNPLLSARGRLRAGTETPAFWLYGLPFSADGQLSIAPPDGPPPVDTRAFSSAFSNAFD